MTVSISPIDFLLSFDVRRKRFHQHLFEMGRIILGRQQIRNRREVRDDLIRFFLDLPHALKIADRCRVIFDADPSSDAERRCSSRLTVPDLDLYDIAALDAINRRPRNTELFRNVIRGLTAADPMGFEATPNLAQFRHCPQSACLII